jgi:hypothetical protein
MIFGNNTRPLFKSAANSQVSDRFSHSGENFASPVEPVTGKRQSNPLPGSLPRLNGRSGTGIIQHLAFGENKAT